MQLSLISLIIILILLIIISGFFSASEIGLMSINRYRLSHLAKKKNPKALRIINMLHHPEKLLSVILIGNTFATIVASTIATLIGQRLGGDLMVAAATILLTILMLIFSELAPKTLAALHPQKIAFAVSWPIWMIGRLLLPLAIALSWISNHLLKLIGSPIQALERHKKEALSTDEIRTVVMEAGVFAHSEYKNMLVKLLDLEEVTVEEIMIPKSDIIGLDLNQPWHVILDQLETAQHTRLPLYHDSIEQLIGVVHVRDLLNLSLEETFDKESLLAAAQEPYFIPEGTLLNIQLLNFQKERQRSGFVVDEYGDLLGLATLEDIFEEVVGEFTTDVSSLSKDILPQDDGSFIIDASVTLRHLKRTLGWKLPALGPKTLSGLIIEYLGYIPPAACCLRLKQFQIEVLKVGDNIIKTVKMGKIPLH